MITNAFIGLAAAPSDAALTKMLDDVRPVWDELLTAIKTEHGLSKFEWNSYSKKAGWSLRVKKGERNIVYLSPGQRAFMASFALGDRAVAAALERGLPVAGCTKYAEGTAVRLDVRRMSDLEAVKGLVAVKLEF